MDTRRRIVVPLPVVLLFSVTALARATAFHSEIAAYIGTWTADGMTLEIVPMDDDESLFDLCRHAVFTGARGFLMDP